MLASCIYREKILLFCYNIMFVLLQAGLCRAGLEGSGVNSDELLVKLNGGIM